MAQTNTPERQALMKAYSGPGWAAKVRRMDDAQVFAIYSRLKAQNKI